jgi:chromosome segregation ATPase
MRELLEHENIIDKRKSLSTGVLSPQDEFSDDTVSIDGDEEKNEMKIELERLRQKATQSDNESIRLSKLLEESEQSRMEQLKQREQERELEQQKYSEKLESMQQKLEEREDRYRQVALDLLEQKKKVSILEYEKRVLVDQVETIKQKEQRAKMEVQKLSQILGAHVRTNGGQHSNLATLLSEIVTLKNRVYQFTDFLQRVKSNHAPTMQSLSSSPGGVSILTTTTTTLITVPDQQPIIEEAIGPLSIQ